MEPTAVVLRSFEKCSHKVSPQPEWQLARETVHQIEAPDILLVGVESQEVVKQQLDTARTLSGMRVRVATFNCNRSLVLDRGLEFYDIGSSTGSFARQITADEVQSASLRLSWAAFDDGHAQVKGPGSRPFVAAMALSDQPCNASIRGKGRLLQVPLIQPRSSSRQKDLEANVEISNNLEKLKASREDRSCSILEELTAHWWHVQSRLKLSGAAAAGLVSSETIRWSELELLPVPWQGTHDGRCTVTSVEKSQLSDRCYAFFLLVGQLVCSIFQILSQEQFVEENSRCVRMRDPVRRSRIKQAWFDLEMIKNNADGDVESHVSYVWEERLIGS